MTALTQEERDVLTLVADWVDREVRPAARELEHANTYPECNTFAESNAFSYGHTHS